MGSETVYYSDFEVGSSPPRKRRLSRRAIGLIGVLAVAAFLLSQWSSYQHDKAIAERVKEFGGSVLWTKAESQVRSYGMKARIDRIYFGSPNLTSDEWRTLDDFSQPVAVTIQGKDFNDERFRSMFKVRNVSHLILAGTAVSRPAIQAFQELHPGVAVDVGIRGNQNYVRFPAREK